MAAIVVTWLPCKLPLRHQKGLHGCHPVVFQLMTHLLNTYLDYNGSQSQPQSYQLLWINSWYWCGAMSNL